VTWGQVLSLLNALWFTAAFVQFSIAQTNTVKILVPREARDNALVPTIKASVSFLGGMNLALALFAFYLAAGPAAFAATEQQVVLFAFFAAANFSQFWFNVPVALRGGRIGQAYWPVFSGPMLKIFVIDAVLAVADAVAAFHFSSI
jgi:hypothetical protein